MDIPESDGSKMSGPSQLSAGRAISKRPKLVVGTCLFVLVAVAIGGLLWQRWGLLPRRESREVWADASQLHGMYDALHGYATQNGGRFPPDLQDLVDMGLLPEKMIKCYSASGAAEESFRYLPGYSLADPAETILAFSPPAFYEAKGSALPILTVDGTVTAIGHEELRRRLAEDQRRRRQAMTAPS